MIFVNLSLYSPNGYLNQLVDREGRDEEREKKKKFVAFLLDHE